MSDTYGRNESEIGRLVADEHEISNRRVARRAGRIVMARNTLATAVLGGATELGARALHYMSIPPTGELGKDIAVGAVAGSLLYLAKVAGTAYAQHSLVRIDGQTSLQAPEETEAIMPEATVDSLAVIPPPIDL